MQPVPTFSYFPLFKTLVEHQAKEETWKKRVRFGPIFRVRSTVWPNICENIGPIFVRAGCKVSTFILELVPNISDNLQFSVYIWPRSTNIWRASFRTLQDVIFHT